MPVITAADVRAASSRIAPLARRTPVLAAPAGMAPGPRVFFKCENLQTGGAFKIRGASNLILSLSRDQLAQGVVAFSSGNHAIAVATAARYAGASATIVMPADAPRTKMEATRAQGAKIVTYDRLHEDREQIAARILESTGGILAPPYDHPLIMAGQGTAAMELLDEAPNLSALVVPIGGGGLISGCATFAREKLPGIRIFGVEPALANDTFLSLAAGERRSIPSPPTIADGLRSPQPGALTFPIIRQLVEQVLLVTEDEIRGAVRYLLEHLKILVEPSGAVAAAAWLYGKLPRDLHADGAAIGIILSGGNLDLDQLPAVLG